MRGPWCNGNTALCPSGKCGFESRRVHSRYLAENKYGEEKTGIIFPSNLPK